ncbi:MAG TPA: oxalate:formate antiporter [Bacillota bacterium]|nr:oxalate:formate antiporter [Bacillota bacterium]
MKELHQEFIEKALPIFKADQRLAGIAAGGSWITNSMDEFSDIDLVISVIPEFFDWVMHERLTIAESLGKLLAAFTGEHVGEPRLLICLYGPPLLHVDLKFIPAPDIMNRVEDPIILWEKDNQISKYMAQKPSKYPAPDLQWVEDRFWVWVHYAANKLGRGEIFEVIEFISFLRINVIGPFILLKNGYTPSGVRRIETKAEDQLPQLIKTVPEYSKLSCSSALKTIISLYRDLREYHQSPGFVYRIEAEKESLKYLEEIIDKIPG